jgi:ligand-binding SRPBCC domain-containing protein
MATHHFRRDLELRLPREEVFPFFADAANLGRITPPWLHFRMVTELPIEMRVGALISYRIRMRGIPLRWTTKITAWEPPWRFVDEQLSGPFRLWVHEHTFEETSNGTLVRDHVEYRVPGGSLVNRFFVRPDMERIFNFREQQLRLLENQLEERHEPSPT